MGKREEESEREEGEGREKEKAKGMSGRPLLLFDFAVADVANVTVD